MNRPPLFHTFCKSLTARLIPHLIVAAYFAGIAGVASAQLVDRQVIDQVEDQVEDQVTDEVRTDVQEQLETEVQEQLDTEVREQVETEVQNQIQTEVQDQLETQIQEVTRNVDAVSEGVQEDVRRAAEADVAAQIDLAAQIDAASQILEDQVPGSQVLDNQVLDSQVLNSELPAQSLKAISQPVETLAKAIPITNRAGQAQFIEVQVEGNWRAIEREWLVVVEPNDLAVLLAVGADILEQTRLKELGLTLVRFRVTAALDSVPALKAKLPAHLHDQLDRNHVYVPQSSAAIPTAPTTESAKKPTIQSKSMSHRADVPRVSPHSVSCAAPVRVGMIDTAIDTQHPAFAQSRIQLRDFAGQDFLAPRAHGTAVAGVLVGSFKDAAVEQPAADSALDKTGLTPLLPDATLYAASVFYPRDGRSQGAAAMNLVRALDWLVAEKVSVINMSLAGPDNQILSLAVRKVIQSRIPIVAAAGNEGPSAPPAFPAAYESVIAVTAVDSQKALYRWANRGNYVDFAALGVKVLTAFARDEGALENINAGKSTLTYETGTSMAAPVVTAAAACLAHTYPNADLNEKLIALAQDLGLPGRDPSFGYGLINREVNPVE